MGGAVLALADAGALELTGALGIINAMMLAVAVAGAAIAARVPRGPAQRDATSGAGAVIPLEHP
jgi:hypothetical protein